MLSLLRSREQIKREEACQTAGWHKSMYATGLEIRNQQHGLFRQLFFKTWIVSILPCHTQHTWNLGSHETLDTPHTFKHRSSQVLTNIIWITGRQILKHDLQYSKDHFKYDCAVQCWATSELAQRLWERDVLDVCVAPWSPATLEPGTGLGCVSAVVD